MESSATTAPEAAPKPKVCGLQCEAIYDGSKFVKYQGRDKDDKTGNRKKWFRRLIHRFRWETDNGDECLNVNEWLQEDGGQEGLIDCVIPYRRGDAYRIVLRGLKEEGGVLQAEAREISPL